MSTFFMKSPQVWYVYITYFDDREREKDLTDKPVALLINPPVYDFALYDLYLRPMGLAKIGRWLHDAGYRVEVVDALSFDDEEVAAAPGRTFGPAADAFVRVSLATANDVLEEGLGRLCGYVVKRSKA